MADKQYADPQFLDFVVGHLTEQGVDLDSKDMLLYGGEERDTLFSLNDAIAGMRTGDETYRNTYLALEQEFGTEYRTLGD